MAASIKVFGLPSSTDVARVLACLFEKDVEFQFIRADTYKKDHKSPEFLKLQDISGRVTFKEGKRTMTDSREICRYIADKFAEQGNKNLLGTGGLERASIEQWLQSEAKSFDPVASQLVFNLAFAVHMGLKPDNALVDQCEKKLNQILDVYDQRLGESCYLAGDEFTLADLSHLPNSHYLVTTEKGNELFYKRKNVQRWWHDISGRDTWKAVVRMQTEHPGPLEKFATIGNDHDYHDHHDHHDYE
ncbi:Glutathione transferase protein [Dioscorea alata]|uniref:Glutathione transferase protein n=1 Tax=Dioscorea alata TaxID=55571 RepID=A0ACB7WPU6_DIOAL|nr:Glutathione transferase protein [Dioscorea alata]